MKMIVQKINTPISDSYDMAYKYFSILSVLNSLELVKRDTQLLAFAASQQKDVSEVKAEFVKKFSTSMATVGNIISKLYKLNVLEKHKRVVKINPMLMIDFNSDIGLGIKLIHNNETTKS